MTVETDFAAAIAANATADGYVGLTYGTSVFPFPEVEASDDGFSSTGGAVAIPHFAAFVTHTDGVGESDVTHDGQEFELLIVDVAVRGGVSEDYPASAAAARAIREAISRRPPTGYLSCFVLGTAPRYEGRDEHQRHRWRVRLLVERHTAGPA